MPARNQFRHQSYTSAGRTLAATLAKVPPPAAVGSAEYQQQLAAAGAAYRTAGVRYLYLMHGTFAGNDALGLFGEIARFFPEVGESLRAIGKSTFDSIAGEVGNYTAEFAENLQTSLGSTDLQVRTPTKTDLQKSTGLEARRTGGIEVRRFNWSSENHHIARADAAVALLDELSRLELNDGDRILVWGHSHAGSVLALVTNLLAADAEDRRRFFHACRSYYRWPNLRKIDLTRWPRVRDLLGRGENALLRTPLDIATFGAPVRYGWDTDGCAKLMHVINHCAVDGCEEFCAPFPPASESLLAGHGDLVQQLGIAGSDFSPGPIAWRAWRADRKLAKLLAPGLARRGLYSRLKPGWRLHADGQNLLFDYGPQEGTIAHHLFGHAVYTQQKWMAFHAQQVAEAFYQEANVSQASPSVEPINE